jgi:hypothetical protein
LSGKSYTADRGLYLVYMRLFLFAWIATAIPSFALFGQNFSLDSTTGLGLHCVAAQPATHMGRKCVRIVPADDGGGIAVLTGTEFHNGVIDVDVAGKPAAGAPGDARGFVGIAFRVSPDAAKYECFYIRPTNGRAEDQERRNHSTQYVSLPDFEWFKLRKETPGKYESYVDLVTGEWTKIKVDVRGVKARLYVNGAAQPALLVNDLKLGDGKGAVALWIGVGTEAHFANLKLSR